MMVEIVAEVGINHDGMVYTAYHLAEGALDAGADWVKFQCFGIKTHPELSRYMLTKDEWARLFSHCRKIGIEPFASVFHPDDVVFMASLGVERYKIARGCRNDRVLIDAVRRTGKPLFVSVPPRSTKVIENVTKLHCVGKYPTKITETELSLVPKFGGYSSHTGIDEDCLCATILGAELIEAHIMLEDNEGPDATSSMTVEEFKVMIEKIRNIEKCA